MSKYRNVLLIAPPSTRPTPAMIRAAYIAQVTGAKLHMICFAHDRAISALRKIGIEAMESARTAYIEHCWKRMDTLASIPPLSAVSPIVDVVYHDHLIDAVMSAVLAREIDLIIKDVALESRLHRRFVNPFDHQLIRQVAQTTMLVNTDAETPPRRIVAMVDTSDEAFEAVNHHVASIAMGLASQCDAHLDLLHVFEGISPIAFLDQGASGSFLAEAYSALLALGRERFERFADTQGVSGPHRHFVTGAMPDSLANFAFDASKDVLVVGSGLSGRLEQALVGSTAEQLVSMMRCDVVLAKPLASQA